MEFASQARIVQIVVLIVALVVPPVAMVFASQGKIAQTAVLTVALVHHLSLPVNPLIPM
jgi:uncharacterized membrane protein YqaE (UPF0057 family)